MAAGWTLAGKKTSPKRREQARKTTKTTRARRATGAAGRTRSSPRVAKGIRPAGRAMPKRLPELGTTRDTSAPARSLERRPAVFYRVPARPPPPLPEVALPPPPPPREPRRWRTLGALVALLLAVGAASGAMLLLPGPGAGKVAAAPPYVTQSIPDFDCADMQHITFMGAAAGTERFHNGAIKGYAEGDWVPFRMTFDWKGGTFDGPCRFAMTFDHEDDSPTAAIGFDALRITGLLFGDSATEGCALAGTVGVFQDADGPPNRLWMQFNVTDADGGRCVLRVDAHLAVGTETMGGAADFPGCSLHAHLQAPPGQRDRCVMVEEGEDADCPGARDVTATTRLDDAGEAENVVTWSAVAEAVSYDVLRAEGSASFEYVATVDAPGTSYVDTDVVEGVTYEYQVTAQNGAGLRSCETAEITAIPDFPTPLAAALALLGTVAVAARRRRA